MNATQSYLALEVLQGLVDAMNQDEDGDFLLRLDEQFDTVEGLAIYDQS
ncbi:TPA: hypothetical protein ACKPIN_003345 [Pseudomonas aeruginosa]